MSKQRFLIIAWPEDHDEDLGVHAVDLQDVIDLAQMGGAIIVGPLDAGVHAFIDAQQGGLP